MYIVRLWAGEMLEGIRFGKRPITPVKVTVTIVMQDEKNAIR